MEEKIKEVIINKNVQNTFIVAVGTLIGSFFSYLSQLLLGRILTVADYGTLNALLSFSNILAVPASVFGISVVKRVAEYTAREDKAMTAKMFKSLSVSTLLFGMLIFVVLFLYTGVLSTKLNINDRPALTYFAVLTGLSFFNIIPVAFIQGLMYYKRWALFTVLTGLFRLMLCVLPAYFGFGVAGVFLGFSANVIVGYIFSLMILSRIFTGGNASGVLGEYKKIMSFGVAMLFVYACLTSFNNIDMVLVKKFFEGQEVGYYAGAVTVGKIFLYGSTAVATIMFPTITALYARKKNFKSQLKQLFIIQLLLIILGLFIFEVFPVQVTTLFFGKTFLNSVPYLRVYSLFVASFIIVNFLVMFLLAIEKTRSWMILLPGAILQGVLILYYRENIFQVIHAGIIASILTAGALFTYLYFVLRKLKIS